MAKQSEAFVDAYNHLMTAIEHIVAVDEVSSAFLEGEVKKTFAKSRLSELALNFALEMNFYKRKFQKITKKVFKSKIYADQQDEQFKGLSTIAKRLYRSMSEATSFLERSMRGEPIDERDHFIRRLESYVNILDAETFMMKTQTVSQDRDHPQFFVSKIAILDNEAMLEILKNIKSAIETGSIEHMRSMPAVERILLEAHRYNVNGREAASRWVKNINQEFYKNPTNRRLKLAKETLDTYEESFDVEDTIRKLLQSFLELDLDQTAAWDRLTLLDPLVKHRTDLQIKRIRIIKEF